MSQELASVISYLLVVQASRLAKLDADKAQEAPKPAKVKASKVKAAKPAATPVMGTSFASETLPAPIKGGQGASAEGFAVWRGQRATGPGFVAGNAGLDHELRKGIASAAGRIRAVRDEAQQAFDAAEASEVLAAEALAEAKELSQAGDRASQDKANAKSADALAFAADAQNERGLATLKLELARVMQDELESEDADAIVRRYREAGSPELTREETIAFDNGSFGGAVALCPGLVAEVPGAPAAPLSKTELDARKARCRAALLAGK